MRILYVATVSGTINAFLIPHIRFLHEIGHQVDIACNATRGVSPDLIEMGCMVHDIGFQRTPFHKHNYIAYKKLRRLIKTGYYDLIHTHTPVASAFVRLACRNHENVKVMYTAHGFHFYKGAPLMNWAVYYPIERWLSRYTDVLITINKEDYERAKKSFRAGRIEYVSGVGLDVEKFSGVTVDRLAKRQEFGLSENDFVVLSVGELNKNKNHETVIRAISKLGHANIQYLICGRGPLQEYLTDLAGQLGLENQVKLLGYRSDIAEICSIADVFAFPSHREGLSVALMEAMTSGLPVVCSDIRGNRDLIEHGKGGYLVKANSVNSFAHALLELMQKPFFKTRMGEYNKDVIQMFDIETVLGEMANIYCTV